MMPAFLTRRVQFQELYSLASTHPQGGPICGDSRPREVNHPSLALDFLIHATSQERSSHLTLPRDGQQLCQHENIQPTKEIPDRTGAITRPRNNPLLQEGCVPFTTQSPPTFPQSKRDLPYYYYNKIQ